MERRELDWKSGTLPAAGWYLARWAGKSDEDAELTYRTEQAAAMHFAMHWIGPLDLPVKAEEPPAPRWGRGPVPADGLYYLLMGDDSDGPEHEARSFTAGYLPVCQLWYGPIPDPPKVEEPETEPNEWADLEGERRCRSISPQSGRRCCMNREHLGHLDHHRSFTGLSWQDWREEP